MTKITGLVKNTHYLDIGEHFYSVQYNELPETVCIVPANLSGLFYMLESWRLADGDNFFAVNLLYCQSGKITQLA